MDSYLEQLWRELDETMTSCSPEHIGNGPEGKWTPAQVLEHLPAPPSVLPWRQACTESS